eukprot:gnl/Carplike_NY0171/2765_a3716_393.p1 GENE.gnl/Carplike_NY0171/2765_a3716_393~~gnl/Carplike_NY0171/2765_a3716_393.p1  ORF type:complete len:300 (+),score=25.64 gnl/Carplike_NY0171/2765_a3716_393:44-901(+)
MPITHFTSSQNYLLYSWLADNIGCKCMKPETSDVRVLSSKTGLSSKQVGIWFNNRRKRLRKRLDKILEHFYDFPSDQQEWLRNIADVLKCQIPEKEEERSFSSGRTPIQSSPRSCSGSSLFLPYTPQPTTVMCDSPSRHPPIHEIPDSLPLEAYKSPQISPVCTSLYPPSSQETTRHPVQSFPPKTEYIPDSSPHQTHELFPDFHFPSGNQFSCDFHPSPKLSPSSFHFQPGQFPNPTGNGSKTVDMSHLTSPDGLFFHDPAVLSGRGDGLYTLAEAAYPDDKIG